MSIDFDCAVVSKIRDAVGSRFGAEPSAYRTVVQFEYAEYAAQVRFGADHLFSGRSRRTKHAAQQRIAAAPVARESEI